MKKYDYLIVGTGLFGAVFAHEMTKKELIFYILFVIIVGLFFFFTRDDLAGKLILIVVCPMVIGYLVYAYNKERKADTNAGEKYFKHQLKML